MNKKILRGVPKKTAEIPKGEERIRLEERQKFADELIAELRRKSEKALETKIQAERSYGFRLSAYYGGQAIALGEAMRLICGKVYEK